MNWEKLVNLSYHTRINYRFQDDEMKTLFILLAPLKQLHIMHDTENDADIISIEIERFKER